MSSHAGAEIGRRLRSQVETQLRSEGWCGLTLGPADFALDAFIHVSPGEFSPTGALRWAAADPNEPPDRVTGVFVGVSFEPLRRLWPLLGQFQMGVVRQRVWPPLALGPDYDQRRFEPRRTADLEPLTADLVGLITAGADEFARRHPTLEALLDELGERRHEDGRHAALLASVGRFEEARDSLQRLRAAPVPRVWARPDRRTVHQLWRWIEHRGDPALLPASPPPPNRAGGERRSPPDWLEPPDHALYEFPTTDPSVTVILDSEAEAWLDEAESGLNRRRMAGRLTAWLSSPGLAPGVAGDAQNAPDPGGGSHAVLVHLGEQAVGHLSAEAGADYRAVLADAAFRGECPCVEARLTRTDAPPGFRLELGRAA